MTTSADVLERALQVLGPNGEHWFKGSEKLVIDEHGQEHGREWEEPGVAVQWCMVGALKEACAGVASRLLYPCTMLDRQVFADGFECFLFANDAPGTTFEDVRLWFKRAIGECQ